MSLGTSYYFLVNSQVSGFKYPYPYWVDNSAITASFYVEYYYNICNKDYFSLFNNFKLYSVNPNLRIALSVLLVN